MDGAICPMHGDICPGEEACAPAILAAEHLNKGIDLETFALVEPSCPIVDAVHAAKITASGLLPFVGGGGPKDDEDERTESQRREDILTAFHLDW